MAIHRKTFSEFQEIENYFLTPYWTNVAFLQYNKTLKIINYICGISLLLYFMCNQYRIYSFEVNSIMETQSDPKWFKLGFQM